MKSFERLLFLVLLNILRCSFASDNVANTNLTECQGHRGALLDDLSGTFRRCVTVTSPSLPAFSANLQLSECLTYTEAFCSSLPSIEHCLEEEGNKWSLCYNRTYNQVFEFFRETVKDTLVDLCRDEGVTLSRFLYTFNRHTLDFRARNNLVAQCIINPSSRLQIAGKSEADIPTKYWILHQEIRKIKDCLPMNVQGDEDIIKGVVEHINKALDTMRCLHPGNESIVMCKNINNEEIDRAKLCPFKTKSELMVPLSLLIESSATSCFVIYNSYGPTLTNAETLEDFQEFFRRYCRRQGVVKGCISDTSLAAEMCLKSEAYEIYTLVRNYLELVLEGGCFEGGRRLATMLHTGHVIAERTNQRESLLNCLKQAQEKRNLTMDNPARIYRYYQELPVVKDCLLEKIGDVDGEDFRNDVTDFIQLLEEQMKCFNPHDRSIVLCKTIQNDDTD